MVKRISLFFAYSMFFILALMYFTPKKSLYFLLEGELKNYSVIISNEEVEDKGFTLELQNADFYMKSIKSANASEVNLKIFVLYNSLTFNDITLSNAAASFVPLHIDELSLSYSIFNPLNVKAYGIGEFGEAEATFNILDRALHLDVEPSQSMKKQYKNSMRQLKKSEDGGYSYDKTF